jgi:hypothetical protein
MGNLFDGLQAGAYDIILTNMGYVATWTPLAGGPAQTGSVLLNKPTQKDDISDDEYAALSTKCEYLDDGPFPGLFDSVQDANAEPITINGVDYYAFKAERKYDGNSVILHLQQKR